MIVLESSTHYRLGPSGAHRWLECPASLRLSEGVPESGPSFYAEEGTVAHAIGERCLRDGDDPIDFGAETFQIEDRLYPVTDEMINAVSVYTDHCFKVFRSDPDAEMLVEHKFMLPKLHPELGGTSDCGIYLPKTKTLHVVDYKHGKGVPVSPILNKQLMIYALGVMDHFKFTAGDVILTIVQPRTQEPHPVKSYSTSAESLIRWARQDLKPKLQVIDNPTEPVAGDHCRFCRAKPLCPALRDKALEVAQVEFAETGPPLDSASFPDPETLTDAELIQAMKFLDLLEPWIKSVGAYMLNKAEQGHQWPGFKLVKKRSNRKWKNEEKAAAKLGGDFMVRKLMSVAKAEKAGADIDGLWEKPDTGCSLVPDSDKRPEVGRQLPGEFIDSLPIFQ